MSLENNLYKYPHPYVTVDGVLLRVHNKRLEVKLIQPPRLDGVWSLPGGFVPVDKLAVDTLYEKMWEKAGVSDFYAEQLQTYDSLERDERGRVITIAYLCLTSDQTAAPGWFAYQEDMLVQGKTAVRIDDLAFDHGQIVRDARQRLTNKLWYSDLPKYLLPDTFKLSEIQSLYEMLEGSCYFTNFRRLMGNKLTEVGTVEPGLTPGRRAKLYRWSGSTQ